MQTTFKTFTQAQGRAKQIAYERATGLKWDVYSTGSGVHVLPIVTRHTPVLPVTECLPYRAQLTGTGSGLLAFQQATGLDLAKTLSVAQTLVRAGLAWPIINRNGNFGGIRRRD